MSLVYELEKLNQLRQQGALSEAEYNDAKATLLRAQPPVMPPMPPTHSQVSFPPPGAVQTWVTAQGPIAGKPAKKSAFLDPKANLKALARISIVLGVLGLGFYFLVRNTVGEKAASTLVRAAVRAPIDLRDEIVNVSAASWRGLPIRLPYAGTLQLEVNVLKGNEVDVYVMEESQVALLREDKDFRHFPAFEAKKTRSLKRSSLLDEGTYYIVLYDNTLGILSESSSDIRVKAVLEP